MKKYWFPPSRNSPSKGTCIHLDVVPGRMKSEYSKGCKNEEQRGDNYMPSVCERSRQQDCPLPNATAFCSRRLISKDCWIT